MGVLPWQPKLRYNWSHLLVSDWPTPSEKYDESSVGMMKFPIYGTIKFMFQTTNQIVYIYICMYD